MHLRRSDSLPLDNHAQIAIGIIVPVLVLGGGILTFIYMTERQRRQPREEYPEMPAPRPKITGYLTRLKGLSQHIEDADAIRIIPPRSDSSKDMHELEDTGQLEVRPLQRALVLPIRKDSAIQAAEARLNGRESITQRCELDTMQAKRQSKAESRYSNQWRSSLQPHEFRFALKPGMSKREAKAASNRNSKGVRYSKDVEARFTKDVAARFSKPDTDVSHDRSQDDLDNRDFKKSVGSRKEPIEKVDDITGDESPTVSDISRPTNNTNRNSTLSCALPDRAGAAERFSGVPSELPSWMKRLSVQDTVEQKWRSDGEIVPPENPRSKESKESSSV